MKELLQISIRQNAIYIPQESIVDGKNEITETTSVLLANVSKLGYTFSEPLLRALNSTNPTYKLEVLEVLKEIMGVNKNWTPLVKGWDIPTGESVVDHIVTAFTNIFKSKSDTHLSCGHTIPENTFPLERYNGCPFCGTPFEFGEIETYGQGSKLKVLDLWTDKNVQEFYNDLLTSKTALDATQVASLKSLLNIYSLPSNVDIKMKETLMLVIDILVENDRSDEAQQLFKNPNDILRYLWYKHTGFLQIIKPKTIIKRHSANHQNLHIGLDKGAMALVEKQKELKLKYSRKECLMVAKWLNNLALDVEKSCEIMHPKRGMWVRFIRALRLAEYSKRKGFENLANLLDVFYNEAYEVWEGRLNHYRLKLDPTQTFALLKQRPGLFARSLFSNMLWFGADQTVAAFSEVIDKVPARLIFTLNMYAENYFNPAMNRSVKPLGGTNKSIPSNKLIQLYDEKQLNLMKSKIEELCLLAMKNRFASIPTEHKTIYIDEALYKIPVAIGDRSETVQDMPSALMGTRFPVEGDTVRLFMQWGKDLPAQHLDMDLSCSVSYEKGTEFCSYSQLVIPGCKHSGDIQSIPDKIGTAEYIDINISELAKLKAKYVTFTCNAYSNGSITPNLVVGWMNSKYPMRISAKTGVAYDPSCVDHQVRISQTASKGLVFGVLDIEAREIIWLEMSFDGQVAQRLDTKGVEALLAKLDSKLNIGNLLELKAEAQNLEIISEPIADENYTMEWAMNSAAVTQLLVD
ncbi:hypothetical protein [uncultured Aquimarina sp.]|uniref:hypothetical protein n=1 Tax=uncultured Aquimarina sp. TaxID=575652 RepID=UPI00263A044A|nr:hypothetical protein [uncultured Aquimarina sp.]